MKIEQLTKMTDMEFAKVFAQIQKHILKDPLENFVKAKNLINFTPTPAQGVAFKILFGQKLDNHTKYYIHQEIIEENGEFGLGKLGMTEVELFESMTGFSYNSDQPDRNRVNLIVGRRGGKCLAKGTEILTPQGPKNIETMKAGDIVYGYDSDGVVRETPVLKVHFNGKKEVIELNSYNNTLVKATKDHTFLCLNKGKLQERKVKDFYKKDQYLRREFVDIPCGEVSEPHAYALGALLGDGCGTNSRGRNDIWISSAICEVPEKVGKLLKAERLVKAHPSNYNWGIYKKDIHCNHYAEWCKDKLAHQKIADLEIIETWDRDSCLSYLAGLLDTDGSVLVRNDCKSLSIEFSCQAKTVVKSFAYLFYRLFQKKLKIYKEDREKYVNGPVYRVRCSANLYTKRCLKELRTYSVHPDRLWEDSYEDLPDRNFVKDKIGVTQGIQTSEDTYDLSIDNDTNLYLLANEGIVTHNSTISAIIAIFSMLKINWRPYLSKTPVATVLILSHSVDFSEEIIDILRNMVEDSPILTKLKDPNKKNTQRIFHLKIPFIKQKKDGTDYIEYSRVRVKVGAASKKTTRGSAVCTLLCDEIAFWNLAENAAESDSDILRAVGPALLQFGKQGTIIKLSSPGIKQGVLYEEWKRREELKDDFIQFKAPSWVWNTILPSEEFKKECRLDQDGFDTEFRANFVDSISNFILPEFVDIATMRGVSFIPPSEDSKTIYSAAIDAAFKSDRFAFSIVGYNETRITTYVIKYWEGSRKEPIRAHTVAKYIRQMCKNYGISEVIGDQHSFQPLREIFEQYGVNLIENTFSLPYKKKIYFGLKRLIHSQQMDLLDIPLLSKEIKELQVEQTNTGQIKIGHPVGGSDDLSDSLAVATYRALENAGAHGIANGQLASAEAFHKVKTDNSGKAFTAPHPEMLVSYQGFSKVSDNSEEYVKDPETGKYRKKSEIEEEESLTNSGADFLF